MWGKDEGTRHRLDSEGDTSQDRIQHSTQDNVVEKPALGNITLADDTSTFKRCMKHREKWTLPYTLAPPSVSRIKIWMAIRFPCLSYFSNCHESTRSGFRISTLLVYPEVGSLFKGVCKGIRRVPCAYIGERAVWEVMLPPPTILFFEDRIGLNCTCAGLSWVPYTKP